MLTRKKYISLSKLALTKFRNSDFFGANKEEIKTNIRAIFSELEPISTNLYELYDIKAQFMERLKLFIEIQSSVADEISGYLSSVKDGQLSTVSIRTILKELEVPLNKSTLNLTIMILAKAQLTRNPSLYLSRVVAMHHCTKNTGTKVGSNCS